MSAEYAFLAEGIYKPERLKTCHFLQQTDNKGNIIIFQRPSIIMKSMLLPAHLFQQDFELSSMMKARRQRFSTQLRVGNGGQLQGEFATKERSEQAVESATSTYQRHERTSTFYLWRLSANHPVKLRAASMEMRDGGTSSPIILQTSGGKHRL